MRGYLDPAAFRPESVQCASSGIKIQGSLLHRTGNENPVAGDARITKSLRKFTHPLQ